MCSPIRQEIFCRVGHGPLWEQVAVPTVLPHERMLFSKAGLPGMYRAVLRFGYLDRIDLGSEFIATVVHEVRLPLPALTLSYKGCGFCLAASACAFQGPCII